MKSICFNPETLELRLNDEKGNSLGSLNINSEYINQTKINISNIPIDRYRVEVSLCCDLACTYCVVEMNKVTQRGKKMSLEVSDRIVRQFNNEVGLKGSILLIGGEPLTNWLVVKHIIEEAKGQTLLFTNCLQLDIKKAKFLKEYDVLVLTSLDGFSLEHNHARFYPFVEERYKKVMNNIKNAVSVGLKVGISCVVHQGNISNMKEIANYFADELNVKSISFAYPHYSVEDKFSDIFSMKEYTENLCQLIEFCNTKKVYIDQIGKKISAILNTQRVTSSCKVGVSQRTFYPDGTETQCTKLDLVPSFSLSDFSTRLPIVNEKCQDCFARNVCGGGCPWDASLYPNEKGVDNRICVFSQSLTKAILMNIETTVENASSLDEAKNLIAKKYLPLIHPI